MRAGFIALAEAEPRCTVVSGDRSPDEVAADILSRVTARLEQPA